MTPWLLDLLQCPSCHAESRLVHEGDGLACPACGQSVPVVNGIPRFVAASENYAEGFGWQWTRWRALQVDRLAGHPLSERRFLADSRWDPAWIKGKLILDAGCGAGRFTDVAAQLGARVVACDLSRAIDACHANCDEPQGKAPERGEVAWVQANLLNLPFRPGVFDAVYCMGVIQHTPDPPAVMRALPPLLKSGGRLAYNFYEKNPLRRLEVVKYALRRITPGWEQKRLLALCETLVKLFFPLTRWMSRIPKVRFFTRFAPICATHPPELTTEQQYEWTVLDTFDWLNPHYEICQDHREVADLLRGLGVDEVASAPGLAWGRKP
ncbi:methyltransferase domain-containing protein [Paramagnetospirillum magnetotacticum]|uniref:methyltransferase domain-containing protein n=1 Tax=Paramagnetospirillum magnetotacticum TaxID=188 RepID=UPI00030FFBF9|nr:methyltransferase domain-containing protein [Paramagnetospirillum magnetotacticum]